MQQLLTLTLMFILTAFGSGCASIVSHAQWPVTINSNPSGANVTIKDKDGVDMQRGTTPMTMTLASSRGYFSPAAYTFSFDKEGYLPATTSLSANMNGWYIGNLLFGGLIGFLIVDPATGAMWRLDNRVYSTLSPDPNAQVKTNKLEVTSTPAKPQAIDSTDDVETQLKKLKELKDTGALTDEEYEARHKALLEKMDKTIKQ